MGINMELYKLWEESVHYTDGWFIYCDGKGNNSVISPQCAKYTELSYQVYQAGQDIGRGGMEPDEAYRRRGLVKKYNGVKQGFELERYSTDRVLDVSRINLSGTLTIPSQIDCFEINYVCKNAFKDCAAIEKIILPETVKYIEENAFSGCERLREVVFQKDIIRIGAGAFEGIGINPKAGGDSSCESSTIVKNVLMKVDCSYKGQYKVPKEVNVIADSAFEGCSYITDITLHTGVKHVGSCAFKGCTRLVSVHGLNSLESLGDFAFFDCISLTSIVVPPCVTHLNHFCGCRSLKNVTLPPNLVSIRAGCFDKTSMYDAFISRTSQTALYVDNWLISYRPDENGRIELRDGTVGIAGQDYIKNNQICDYSRIISVELSSQLKYIGSDAFSGTRISKLELPAKLRIIEKSAFKGTALEYVRIPECVERIDIWAFQKCNNLKIIEFDGNPVLEDHSICSRADHSEIVLKAKNSSNNIVDYYNLRKDTHNLVFVCKTV